MIAYNHVRDEQFLSMIEDAICVRVATNLKQKKPLGFNQASMMALTEGMSVLGVYRKPLVDLLKRLLIEQDANKDFLINANPQLCLQVINFLDDFEVELSDKLRAILNSAVIKSHVKQDRFTLRELSYLALHKDILTKQNQTVLKHAIEKALPQAEQVTQEEMERFVLAYPDELVLIEPMT